MEERSSWYDTCLIDGRDPQRQVSYATQAGNLKKAMQLCGVASTTVTHSKRSSSTVMAEAGGVDEAQIRRAGRWNLEKVEGCYLTNLPKQAMRALVGFSPEGGSFYLKRTVSAARGSLESQIFPIVEDYEGKFLRGGIDRDIAGQGSLKLLKYPRPVISKTHRLSALATSHTQPGGTACSSLQSS
ncbi:hypothetical protein PybrP1_007572 [[Pythium] brassicae (nom. inval.)]|nr:hypothetical protein PybrP1_007572 [[Pythium] brassicae (nom. inval.)]